MKCGREEKHLSKCHDGDKRVWCDNPLIAYLWIVRVLGLVIEMENVRLCAPSRMQIAGPHQRGYRVSVAERLHRRVPVSISARIFNESPRVESEPGEMAICYLRIPNIDGVLDGFVPVRVFVSDGREDLVEVKGERVPDERPQEPVPLVLLQAVLNVRRGKVVVALHRGHAQHQLSRDETFAAVLHGEVRIRIGRPGRHKAESGENLHLPIFFRGKSPASTELFCAPNDDRTQRPSLSINSSELDGPGQRDITNVVT